MEEIIKIEEKEKGLFIATKRDYKESFFIPIEAKTLKEAEKIAKKIPHNKWEKKI